MRTIARCKWAEDEPEKTYHDTQWGTDVKPTETTLLEYLTLESAQAGLSWRTILLKRGGYLELYRGFRPEVVASMTEADVQRLVEDARIVRHRGKIEASIQNARVFCQIAQEYGSFWEYLMTFTEGKRIVNMPQDPSEVPSSSPLSDTIAKDLKSKGMKFVGSTILYSFLQAIGIVDDHEIGCPFKSYSTAYRS